MRVPATFFDGKTAEAVEGELELLHGHLQIHFGSAQRNIDIESSRLTAPVGNGPWAIELSQGGRIQFSGMDFGRHLSDLYGRNGFVDWLESSWRWVAAALVLSIVGTWLMLTKGVPVVARHVAYSMPAHLDKRISDESIDLLDQFLFQESRLAMETKDRVGTLFEEIRNSDPAYRSFRLEFRSSDEVGANAFAIPGGLVVVTDDMVALAREDAELIAVLAHEVGHLVHRHSLRILLQNAASAVIIAGLTGDLTNVTALSATVPTVMMQAKYSRDFEREADGFAFAYLTDRGLDTSALSSLLRRLETEDRSPGAGTPSDWFSSHPRSVDRVPGDK